MYKKNAKVFIPDKRNTIGQSLKATWLSAAKITAVMLRLDLLHPEVSGNKWFKLKYNFEAALRQQKDTVLTFGGAHSNHIAATAAAARLFKLNSIGIIRGDITQNGNPTLSRAVKNGMRLHFMGRAAYRHKDDNAFMQELQNKYPQAFLIPEGGKNDYGIKGAGEILQLCPQSDFTHICCPVGTGTTLTGLIASTRPEQEVIGFCALKKADEQRAFIKEKLRHQPVHARWQMRADDHFGGFAKRTKTLDDFMTAFQQECSIELDFIYTAKMVFGIKKLVDACYFPSGSKLLIIHTGGLQGNISTL